MKRIFLLAAAALYTAAAEAQSMERLFAEMPDSIVPVMTRNDRLDCIDFYKSGMKPNVKNIYGGKSELLVMKGGYLLLRATQKSTVAMKKLGTTDGDTILAVVSTYSSPAKESSAAFYTTGWKRIDGGTLAPMPAKEDFLTKADTCDAARLAYAKALCENAFMYAELSEDEPALSCALSLETLTPEEERKVRPYVSGRLVFKWNGKAFVR